MKILIFGNTYYQLLTAIQIKLTLFKEDKVDLFFSDHSCGAREVVERLKAENLFFDVQYIETKNDIYNKTLKKKLGCFFKLNFGHVKAIQIKEYDEILFYNLPTHLYELIDYYDSIGHTAKWSRFEEGLLSYSEDCSHGNIVAFTKKIRKFSKRTDVATLVSKYYCFFPELKNNSVGVEFVRIPLVLKNRNQYTEIVNRIFDYHEGEIKQKYVFFASSSDIDGNAFGETECVLKLAKEIGIENLLVKMHPRDTRNIYQELGIAVMENSDIPWEVFQLNNDFSDNILLTIHSGAFLSITAIMGQNIEARFLYPAFTECTSKYFTAYSLRLEALLEQMHANGLCDTILASNEVLDS